MIRNPSRGHLKIFLGYAAGAGKTYRMLEEAQKLKSENIDVVVGYFEPHARKDTIAKTVGLEMIPRRRIEYRGCAFEEMDTPAILARHPKVCAVDELAHTNVPGSERTKRWEDVLEMIEYGIDVISTMNLQHIESLNDQILQITGVRVRETVPDWVINEADEVVMIDVTPEALINRIKRGVVYKPEKAQQALQNFFKEATLGGLRELALRQAAHEVELRQEDSQNRDEVPGPASEMDARTQEQPQNADRILIHLTSHPSSAMLIRRGRRVADFLRAECFAVYISPTGNFFHLSVEEREAADRHLNFARSLHIETRVLQGADVTTALVDFARHQHVTQIFMSRSALAQKTFLQRNLVFRVLRLAPDIQITVVAERSRPKTA